MCNICNDVSEEEQFKRDQQEFTNGIREVDSRAVQSVKIDDNVTLHLLSDAGANGSKVAAVLKMLQENYPAPGKVDVYFPASFSDDDSHTQGQTMRVNSDGIVDNVGNDRVMFISHHAFTTKRNPSFWHSPAYANLSEYAYVIIHEWGHVKDNRDRSENPLQKINPYSGTMMNIITSLSQYGCSDEAEAYAESWLEWSVTNGQTTNFAAKWYAKEYNWPLISRQLLFPPYHGPSVRFDDYNDF